MDAPPLVLCRVCSVLLVAPHGACTCCGTAGPDGQPFLGLVQVTPGRLVAGVLLALSALALADRALVLLTT